jgi:hypothetical protein
LKPKTYLEPFALRALGFARKDDGLIAQAIQRFEAMGLDWHAAETRKLLPLSETGAVGRTVSERPQVLAQTGLPRIACLG